MNIEKAIEILTYPPAHTFDQLSPDYYEAVKLGIEALKAIQSTRKSPSYRILQPLPGETE